MQQRELPRGSGRTLPERQTRPAQRERGVVDQLQDPRPQQPDRHQQEHRRTKPGRSVPDEEEHQSRECPERGESRVERTRDSESQRGAEGDRDARGSPCGTDESGHDQGQHDVSDDRAEAAACLRCGQGPQGGPGQRRPCARPGRSGRHPRAEVCRPRGQRHRRCEKPGDRGADRRRGGGDQWQVLDDPGERREDRKIGRRLEGVAQPWAMPTIKPRVPQPGGVAGHGQELATGDAKGVGGDQPTQQ